MNPTVQPAPAEPDRGLRPAHDLVLRNAIVIDGTGAPPYGPATVRVCAGRIAGITSGRSAVTSMTGPAGGHPEDVEIDVAGGYVLPGLIDAHAHIGDTEQVACSDYPFRLWLANGVTTVREAGSLRIGLDFVAAEAARSDRGEITAPRVLPYVVFGQGLDAEPRDRAGIAAWMADVAARGAVGVKFFGSAPDVMRIALAEAAAAGLRTMCHHSQSHVAGMNARDTAGWGLGSLEHGYGLPEAMFATGRLQRFPADYNYDDEHHRFAELGRSWAQAAAPGSDRWNELIDELVACGLTLVPTFVAHLATRDLEHARGRRYHQDFTTARLQRFFTPGCGHHGSFFGDWGSVEEAAWRRNYQLWMRFVYDYFQRGGRVCPGSDAGFIYNTFGFGLIEELELFCEAGFSPAEAVTAATLHAAQLLGVADDTGTVEVGKRADLLVVDENPLANLKVLSAAGHLRHRPGGTTEVVGGPRWTIKDGIGYDARELAGDVREYVAAERAEGDR